MQFFVNLFTFSLINFIPVSVLVAECRIKAAYEWELRPITKGEKNIELEHILGIYLFLIMVKL